MLSPYTKDEYQAAAFEISRIHSLVGLRLTGELDLFTSAKLAPVLAEIDGMEPIHIDLSELTFIDSAGIGAILTCAGSRAASGRIVLMNPTEPVRRALEIAGVDRHPAVQILLAATSVPTYSSAAALGLGHSAPSSEAA